MKTIWKHAMKDGRQYYRGSKVLHVGYDPANEGMPTVWMEVDPDDEKEKLALTFVGTGHAVPTNGIHVGTMITPGRFVWHVYDVDFRLNLSLDRPTKEAR